MPPAPPSPSSFTLLIPSFHTMSLDSFFRPVSTPTPAPFFPNQSAAAEQVFGIFTQNRQLTQSTQSPPPCHYVLLNADVQVGKTGTYQAIIRRMLESRTVKHALVLCGSHETTLREQAMSDMRAYNPHLQDRVTILFRQDFRKYAAPSTHLTDTLIIVDESHMDQGHEQELAAFLGRYGLALDGTRPVMVANRIYIVSVDATPYSELSAIHNTADALPKAVVHLETGIGYFGPADYYKGGLVKRTFNMFTEEFDDLLVAQGRKWVLIRLTAPRKPKAIKQIVAEPSAGLEGPEGTEGDVGNTNGHRKHQHLKALADKHGFALYEFTSKRADITLKALQEPPPVTSIVVLYNRLRAGKVVPKAHVGFVWEDAATSKTDAVIQGLFGRMCGYQFGPEKPTIYLPASLLASTAIGDGKKMNEIERHIDPTTIPTRATNICPPSRCGAGGAAAAAAAALGLHACPPLRIELDSTAPTPKGRKGVLRTCLAALKSQLHIIDGATALTEDQKDEIKQLATSDTHEGALSLREFTAGKSASFTRYFDCLVDAFDRQVPPTEHVSTFKPLTFAVVHASFEHSRAVAGHVYVLAYTKAGEEGAVVTATNTAIPNNTGTTIFNRREGQEEQGGQGEQGVKGAQCLELPFTPTAAGTLEDFETEIRRCVGSVPSRGTITCKGIRFDRGLFRHRSSRENLMEEIVGRIGVDLGARFVVKYKPGRFGKYHFEMDVIEWRCS